MRKHLTSILVFAAAALFAMPSSAQNSGQFKQRVRAGQAMAGQQKVMKVDARMMDAKKKAESVSDYGKPFNVFAPKAWTSSTVVKSGIIGPERQLETPADLRIISPIRTLNVSSSAASMKAPRRAETVEDEVIVAPDEGTKSYYKRSGSAWYPNGQYNSLTDQEGITAQIVETEDGTVYIKDVVSQLAGNSWVKGTKEGNTITIATGQYLMYSNYTYFYLAWAKWDDVNEKWVKDTERTTATFTIDGNTISLDGSDENNLLGVFYDYYGTTYFDGEGDFGTVFTLEEDHQPASTELVELPADANVEEWFTSGVNNANGSSTPFKGNAKVAFVGNDVYVNGFFTDFPDSWIKGTLEGNTVTFSSLQFLGHNDGYDVDAWAIGLKGFALRDKFTMTYDATAETLTLNDQLLCNAAEDAIMYFQWLEELTIMKTEPDFGKVDELPYSNGFGTDDERAAFTIIDANEDGSTWAPYNSMMRYRWNSSNAGDDWLVSPAIKLVAGKKYHFSIQAHAETASYAEKIEVKMANEGTAEALSAGKQVIPETVLDFTTFRGLENEEVTVSETGYYYFGIHAISDADKYYLTVDDFLVEAMPISAPYEADFSSEAPMGDFMILDNNEDAKTWSWTSVNGAFYTYNAESDADDYLILPINLKANINYDVTVNANCALASYPEKFEVVAGKEGTPEGMNITVIEPTDVTLADPSDFTGNLTVEEDGLYYVAIHAISPMNMYRLCVHKFSITKALDPTAPDAPTIVATPAEMGMLEATVNVTAPANSINGEALEADNLTKIELYRDGILINTWENPAAGQVCDPAFVDNAEAGLTNGMHKYTAIPYDKNGDRGQKSEEVSVYVGIDVPGEVTNATVEDNVTNIAFAWDPVGEVGQNNGYVNPAEVEYKLWTVELQSFFGMTFPTLVDEIGNIVGETNTSVDFNTDEGNQKFQYFAVQPTNIAGVGTEAYTGMLIGAPYELPLVEGFKDSELHYYWESNANLGVSADASDDDGVALAMYSDQAGMAYFMTGKVNINNAENPELIFNVKSDNISSMTVMVSKDGGEFSVLQDVDVTDEYATIEIPLASLKGGRFIQLALVCNIENPATESEINDNLVMDNIRIADVKANDLAINVVAPAKVKAGETATITAKVENIGGNAASDYTVIIKAGEKEIYNETFTEDLAAFDKNEIEAEFKTTVFDEQEDVTITAEVVYAADADNDNNIAETVITVNELTAAQPENVKAEDTEEGVVVTWDAPAAEAVEVTEDFEGGFGDFTSIDADADGNEWIHHLNSGSSNLKAHSGDGLVVSYSYENATYSPLTPDNWLVSPKAILDGTFKFWAVAQDPNYSAEHFAVYVSTESGTDVSTFTQVSDEFVATGEYTEYTVDLSSYAGQEGWIAIRHFNCTDMFCLVVDDVTYQAAAVEPSGYNVYVDGELVTTVTDGTTVTLEGIENGTHTIAVSAIYDNGQESKPVEVEVEVTLGIMQLTIGGEPVDVYSIDGKLVRKNATNLNGLKGAYIINGKKYVVK